MLEFGELLNDVDRHRGKLTEVCGLEEGYLESTGYLAFTLLGHYAIWGTALPRAYPAIGREQRGRLVLDLSKVLWFLVMHELGHIDLGHLDSFPTGVTDRHVLPAVALDEGQNELKLREFEADEYIIESLDPSVRGTFLSWALLPLQMFCSLERLLTNYRDTHPMAINRLNYLKTKAESIGDQALTTMVEDVLVRQIQAQDAYASSKRNMAFHTSYEIAREALFKLQQYAAYSRAKDISAAFSGAGKHAEVWDAMTDHFWSEDD